LKHAAVGRRAHRDHAKRPPAPVAAEKGAQRNFENGREANEHAGTHRPLRALVFADALEADAETLGKHLLTEAAPSSQMPYRTADDDIERDWLAAAFLRRHSVASRFG
jgi:hypothetical protein